MVTTGNGGQAGRKWLQFRITLSDANINPAINRICKNLYPRDSAVPFSDLTRPQKLDILNQHLIDHLKALSLIENVDEAVDAAKAQAVADILAQTDFAEEA